MRPWESVRHAPDETVPTPFPPPDRVLPCRSRCEEPAELRLYNRSWPSKTWNHLVELRANSATSA